MAICLQVDEEFTVPVVGHVEVRDSGRPASVGHLDPCRRLVDGKVAERVFTSESVRSALNHKIAAVDCDAQEQEAGWVKAR